MPSADSYSVADVTTLNTHSSMTMTGVGVYKSSSPFSYLSRYTNSTCVNADMDLFGLISAQNPTKGKTGTRPRVVHEVPLLTATASRVIDIEDKAMASGSLGTPSALENLEKDVATMGPLVNKRSRKRGKDEAKANVPPKVLRKYHVAFRPAHGTLGGKSLALLGLYEGFTIATPATQDTPIAVNDPDPLSYAKPQPHPKRDIS
nr:hypothetical protein [Tanacetum cinerariifolium]